MSKYIFVSEDQCYCISVGLDKRAARFFLQVEKRAGTISQQDEPGVPTSAISGVFQRWEGATFPDMRQLVQAVAVYTPFPFPIQVQLVRDWDSMTPLPLMELGTQLAAICQQSPAAIFRQQLDPQKNYYLYLNQEGWHACEWETASSGLLEETFPSLICPPDENNQEAGTFDILSSYVSDPSISIFLDDLGFFKRLPVFAVLTRGTMLSGPIVISNENGGLTPGQIQTIQQEVLFVDETLRPIITDLWYHAWHTLRTRGFALHQP